MSKNHLMDAASNLAFCRARGADAGAYAGQKFKDLQRQGANLEEWANNVSNSLVVALASMRESGSTPDGIEAWSQGFKEEISPIVGSYRAAAIFFN